MDVTGKIVSMVLLGLFLVFVIKILFPVLGALGGFLVTVFNHMSTLF
jgi:hypothetical protein